MDQELKEARTIIGQGSDFKITWVEDITALSEIENLLMSITSVSGDLSKEVLLAALDPKVHYCLERCDSSIQSVGELIENFTFLDATIFHNRNMHASLHQKISIQAERLSEFNSYLSMYLFANILSKTQLRLSIASS